MVVAQLLDHMVDANKEVESEFNLASLITQLEELTKNIMEIEDQGKNNEKHIPPRDQRKPKNNQ